MSDKNKIPKGHYCYSVNPYFDSDLHTEEERYIYCPYSTYKNINGVNVPWCSFLEKGGVSNNTSDEEYEKLLDHYGIEELLDKELPLDLLWDSIKECGENK